MRVMKNSGVDWINIVPNSWNTTRLKRVLVERNEKNNPIKTTDLLSLSIERGVFPYSEKTGGGNKAKENFEDYKLAYVNDIVLNSMNVVVGAVGISKYYGCVSPVYYTLYSRNNELYNINYYNYIFQSEVFQKNLWGLGNGIVVKESDNGKLNTIRMRIPMEKLNGVILPVPSIEEQEKIANFLDEKIQEIDTAIEKTKETIEDYKKLKNSIIYDKVLKGINDTDEIKHTKFKWFNTINKKFEIVPIKRLFNIYSGATPKTDNNGYWNGDVKWITPSDYKTEDKYVYCGERTLTKEGYKSCGTSLVKKDSLIFSKRAPIGTVAINKNEVCTNQGCLSCEKKNENINIEYYYYLFSVLNNEFNLYGTGTTFKEISFTAFSDFKVIYPDKDEQDGIVLYLNKKCKEINNLIRSKEKIIEELENYKKSVIYEYVTGKKEVK